MTSPNDYITRGELVHILEAGQRAVEAADLRTIAIGHAAQLARRGDYAPTKKYDQYREAYQSELAVVKAENARLAASSRENWEKFEKLQKAVKAVYYGAYWTSDRLSEKEEARLMAWLRDAAGLERGQTQSILGPRRQSAVGIKLSHAYELLRAWLRAYPQDDAVRTRAFLRESHN